MNPEFMVIIIPFALAALLSLVLAAAAWQRARSPGSLSFALCMLAAAFWLVTSGLEIWVPDPAQKVQWAKIAYLGTAWVGTLWLWFCMDLTQPDTATRQRGATSLAAIPIITIALVMTNEMHGLMWSKITPYPGPFGLRLVYEHGAWFWVFVGYTYLALAAGMVLLARGLFIRRDLPRLNRQRRFGQVAALSIGVLLPWLMNIGYLFNLTPWPGLDLTPYTLTITGLIYAWTFFRLGLLEQKPVAYEAILANLTSGFLVVEAQGTILEANPAACRFLGLTRESILGMPYNTALRSYPALVRLLRSNPAGLIEFASRADPKVVLEASTNSWSSDMPGSGGVGYAGRLLVLQDITRRRLAEEGLRKSEQLYRLMVTTAPVGITLTDTEGKITFSSPVVREMHGARAEDVDGTSVIRWIHPEDRTLAIMRMLKIVEDQENLPPQVYRLLRKDGSVFWGEISSASVMDHHGEPLGLLAITRDVTQSKSLEMRLEQGLRQQTFINTLLQLLYRAHDLHGALNQLLEQVGLFFEVTRVYLCQDSPDYAETTISQEWCCPGVSLRARETPLVRYATIPTWQQWMEEKGCVLVADVEASLAVDGASEIELPAGVELAPEDIAEFFGAWGAKAGLALPIYSGEQSRYGFLALDDCENPRLWSPVDLQLLNVVCRIVSSAVFQIEVEAAEQRQRALAEALHDTASALNSTLNLEEVLDRILSNLERVVPRVSASIALVEEDDIVRFVRWRGYPPEGDEVMTSIQLRVSDRQTYQTMAETGAPIIISDAWMDKRWVVHPQYNWIRSYAGVPVRNKGRLVGFINLDSPEPDFFSSELSYSLHVFADQAAVAIENARLYDAARRRAEEMSILNRIGMSLTAGVSMDQVLVSLFEACRQVLPIDVFSVALYDRAAGRIDMPLYYNDGEFQSVPSRDINIEPGLTGAVLRARRTISLPDTLDPQVQQQFSIIRLGGRPARSYVGVPLVLLNEVVGVISMQSYRTHAYTAEQIGLLETIATQAAIAVQNARLYEQMRQMAITDTVTELHTRRHFTSLGVSEVERAQRYDRRLSVLMVDIDHFKRVNDTYGHNAGDQVLLAVAKICREALRATDIVGRWGGEEFAIVLPEADRDGASLIAERIRRMVAEMEIPSGPQRIRVTVSIGVATLSKQRSALEVLIDCADRALYMAKQGGRNQVKLFE